MIKRILVALDIDPDTTIATKYASEIALRYEGEVSGLAMVDTKQIASEVGGGAIGTMYYAENMRTRLVKIAHKKAFDLTNIFDKSLAHSDIVHEKYIKEGIPFQHIIQEMKYHDLLVIGRDSHFLYSHPDKDTPTLAKVVKKGTSPTLVVTKDYREISSALIAYDGSDPSVRTMQRFAQLQPFGCELDIHLIYVRTNNRQSQKQEADLRLSKASEFLRAHNFERVMNTSIEGGNITTTLLEHANMINANLLVAGAHSVSALQRMAFGSTTDGLLRQCEIPIFLFH